MFNTKQRSRLWHCFLVALSILFEGMPCRPSNSASLSLEYYQGRDAVPLREADFSPHHEMSAIIFSDRLLVDGCAIAWPAQAELDFASDRKGAGLQQAQVSGPIF
ncbi:hypothetical protein I6F07_15250 [Ensifer sp. IC4062]|nr:hypothetical protein [Ensifer sp. IC4062]MCA1441550.1 hypothetical protein [Ensifer sp. IC4062]